MENELYSPIVKKEDDPILNELTFSQRLEIEGDYKRFHNNEISYPFTDAHSNEDENVSFQINPLTGHIISDASGKEAEFLKTLKQTRKNKSTGIFKNFILYAGIAAIVVLSFFAGKLIIGYLSGIQELTSQQAYSMFYNPSADNELKTLVFDDQKLKSAYPDYKRSDPGSAPVNSNQIYDSEDDNELSLLFLGLISMERNDFPEACKSFTRILSFEKPLKWSSASFYLSLSYLHEGQIKEAKPLLEKLSSFRNPYQKKAKVILRRVKH